MLLHCDVISFDLTYRTNFQDTINLALTTLTLSSIVSHPQKRERATIGLLLLLGMKTTYL